MKIIIDNENVIRLIFSTGNSDNSPLYLIILIFVYIYIILYFYKHIYLSKKCSNKIISILVKHLN